MSSGESARGTIPGISAPLSAEVDPFIGSARAVFGLGSVWCAEGSERSEEPPRLSLESSTLDHCSTGLAWLREGHTRQRGLWNVTLTEYPDGPRAVVWQSMDPVVREPRSDRGQKEDGLRWGSALVRSRARIRHLCRCLAVRYMWTFTKRGKFSDLDELWGVWKEFCRLMSVRFPAREWRYVAVPELHQDGETWHLHVGVPEFWDVTVLRRLWYRALGGSGRESGPDTPGNLDVRDKAARRGARSARVIAGYIASYVGKGLGGASSGRRLFSSTKHVVPLKRSCFHWAVDISADEFRESLLALLSSIAPGRDFEIWSYGDGPRAVYVADS